MAQIFDRYFDRSHRSSGGLLGAILGLLLLLGGCEPSPQAPFSSADQTPTATPFAVPSTAPSAATTVTVQIYSIDATCETLVPSQLTVPADQSLEASIATLLTRGSPDGLSPIDYSISVDSTTGQATLDLRPTPSGNPQRSFQSLSSCEQLALFGSLRETLLRWPAWGIRSVEFTEKGKPIVL